MKKSVKTLGRLVQAAQGLIKADLVLKNVRYLNVFTKSFETGDIAILDGYIAGIGEYEGKEEIALEDKTLVPGFIDGHIHLESSMVSPANFAAIAAEHGTACVVTDPHEIANVMGLKGLEYYLQATDGLPVDVFMMVPSCVPATPLDESGAELSAADIKKAMKFPRVCGLAEMMNYPGVLAGDKQVLKKLLCTDKLIDGHAPGLSGKALQAYAAAGVKTDHECAAFSEALEKIKCGQWILIREGTAAQNLEALAGLLKPPYSSRVIFVTDDKHPGDLMEKGHINYIVKKAVSLGADPIEALTAASLNAATAYQLKDYGAIAPGYRANIAVLDDLTDFNVSKTLHNGKWAGEKVKAPKIDKALLKSALNSVHMPKLREIHFVLEKPAAVIAIIPNQILTGNGGMAEGVDVQNDILKIACIERHHNTGHIGLGYIKGYGLKSGAIASSVGHDSHNVVVIGTNDRDMAVAANAIREMSGGIVVVQDGEIAMGLPLEICGLMTDAPLEKVHEKLEQMKSLAAEMGVNQGVDSFMTLAFMSLPVIPSLRILTTGMFDVDNWQMV